MKPSDFETPFEFTITRSEAGSIFGIDSGIPWGTGSSESLSEIEKDSFRAGWFSSGLEEAGFELLEVEPVKFGMKAYVEISGRASGSVRRLARSRKPGPRDYGADLESVLEDLESNCASKRGIFEILRTLGTAPKFGAEYVRRMKERC